ncbi:MAG: general secretion pathway protein C [Hydrogenophaga sp.]|nr:general secretion pathway protein C [Hydrogenophaga sp.]
MAKVPLSVRVSQGPDRVRGPLAPALLAGVLWVLAGLALGYFLLQIWGMGPLKPVTAIAGNPLQVDQVMLARALGAQPDAPAEAPAAPTLSSRFQLLGVIGQPGQRGAALIAMDGQPPRPVTVGDVIEDRVRLLAVDKRLARLGTQAGDPAGFELRLPETKD